MSRQNIARIDWEAIEREYRAGQLSVSEIGRQHGISHTAINKRAKKEGWTKDLAKRVRQEVSARLVSEEVSSANAQEAIDVAAARGVELVRQHRATLHRANKIVGKLLSELDDAIDNRDEIEAAIAEETETDNNAQRRNAMLKAVSLPSRAATARELSQTIKNLVPLERQAFNLDADDKGEDDAPALSDEARAKALAHLLAGLATPQ